MAPDALSDAGNEAQRGHLETATDVVRRIATADDLDELGTRLVTALAQALRTDACALYVVGDGEQLSLVASRGLTAAEQAQAQQRASGGHPGWVVRFGRPLLCSDATSDPRVMHVGRGPRHLSILCAPLAVAGGRIVGAIEVSARPAYAFHAGDLHLLETVALHTAIYVGNAAQVAAAERRADLLERISLAGQAIAAALGVPQLLASSARIVADLFGVADAGVYLLGSQGEIQLEAHCRPDGRDDAVHAGDVAHLLSQPGPRAIPDLRDAPGLSDIYLRLIERGVHSLLAVPFTRQAHTIGGMLLFARMGDPPFDREAQEMALIVAGQIAVGIENARLYEETVLARERTETVIQLSSAGILTLDDQGYVRDSNPAAAEILGAGAGDIVGRHVDDILGVTLWGAPDSLLTAVRSTGRPAGPFEQRLAGGPMDRERDVLLGLARLPDGYLLSMADITRLKELDRLKTQLVANVSHELRSPLTDIKAYSELLREGIDGGDPELRRRFVTVIEDQADRLAQTIGNLLDLARIEAEGYQLRPEVFDLAALIAEAANAVADRAAARSVRVVARPLPRATLVSGDRPILGSMLRNLLDNAVKFSNAGGTVNVRTGRRGRRLAIAVQDSGVGIAPDEMDRLFRKFSRLSSATNLGVDGTGLGLVIARQAARAHGGDIRVRSAVGKGSTFTVVLPDSLVVSDEDPREGPSFA